MTETCRRVDRVMFKATKQSIDLWTIDVNLQNIKPDNHYKFTNTLKEKQNHNMLHSLKKKLYMTSVHELEPAA